MDDLLHCKSTYPSLSHLCSFFRFKLSINLVACVIHRAQNHDSRVPNLYTNPLMLSYLVWHWTNFFVWMNKLFINMTVHDKCKKYCLSWTLQLLEWYLHEICGFGGLFIPPFFFVDSLLFTSKVSSPLKGASHQVIKSQGTQTVLFSLQLMRSFTIWHLIFCNIFFKKVLPGQCAIRCMIHVFKCEKSYLQ